MRKQLKRLAPLLLAVGLMAGCATQSPGATTPVPMTPSDATPAAVTPAAGDIATSEPVTSTEPATDTGTITDGDTGAPVTLPDTGMAVVENIDVRILESFPVQVHAAVSGYLPDSCTTISAIEAVQEENTFRIHITTERPADAICAMVITEFEQVVPLNTAGLPGGTYEVVANDLSVSFELPGDGSEPQPQPEAGAYPVTETETSYVMAQMDVPIFDAPMGNGNEIGMIAAGQMASVTGASPDGAWWRVICPDDSVGDCWVSAAPEMTAPATSPN